MKVAQRLGLGERGRYMAAFTFGNVHGSYKPGVVKLRPELLGDIQREAAQAVVDGRIASAAGAVDFPNGKPFALVFHGGSGSRPEEIAEAVRYGVVKMNIDTDTQYAFTRAIADQARTIRIPVHMPCSRWTARSARRSCTIRAPGAARPRARWRPASWRPASSSVPPAKP